MLGVFGLSIRTRESDLDHEFGKWGAVDKVVIVYDQRVRPLAHDRRMSAQADSARLTAPSRSAPVVLASSPWLTSSLPSAASPS